MTDNQSSAGADVLGRLLVLQQTLDAMPDETRIAEFTKQALMTVPGVSEVLMHICDPMLSYQAKLQEIRAECVRQGCMPNSPDPMARSDEGGIHYFPLRKGSHLFGFLTVRAADEGMLDPYIDLLSNIANAIGSVLDSRMHHTQLSRTTEMLLQRTCELEASNEKLQLQISERQHAERELAERSQELTRSNTELEQLAYVASHDLQEPLRMVASYLQLLEKKYQGQLDADAHEYIEFAVDGAKRMQSLINDLLTYSRVGAAASPRRPTDCTAVVDAVLRSLRVAIEESGAHVEHGQLPVVMGAEEQLVQLFQNLIANAIKFRSGPQPRIVVSAEAENGCWRFAVQDNGIGIAQEYFDRIFVMFQRLHSRSAYPGTGIGLAICKKIVERHGGRIWVESEPGQGTVFKFTLQRAGKEQT
jgi:light-regulated signal transduction histidine kinase (bacteriophytochrome)